MVIKVNTRESVVRKYNSHKVSFSICQYIFTSIIGYFDLVFEKNTFLSHNFLPIGTAILPQLPFYMTSNARDQYNLHHFNGRVTIHCNIRHQCSYILATSCIQSYAWAQWCMPRFQLFKICALYLASLCVTEATKLCRVCDVDYSDFVHLTSHIRGKMAAPIRRKIQNKNMFCSNTK